MEYFYQTTPAVNNYEIQILNESITLGIISNFIREGSSFTYNIVNYDNFFQSLSVIYATNGKFECTELQEYQYNTIQLNVLQILRNYMGIETNENKKNLFEYIPLTAILEKASFGLIEEDVSLEIKPLRIQQKLVAMDILRNCTAGSETLCDEIMETYDKKFVNYYPSAPRKWFDFVIANVTNFELFDETGSIDDDEFVLKMLGNDDYVKLVTSINFIENHKYTKSRITQKEFPPDALLSIWLRFLNLEIPEITGDSGSINARVTVTNNLNEVKLSIIWIIINLTMYTSRYGLTMSSETSYKLFDTVQLRPDNHESTHKIDIDEGDIEPIAVAGTTDATSEEEMTVKDRAKALQTHGFLQTIDSLIDSYSHEVGNETTHEYGFIPKCFSIQSSYDLLERLRNARDQIVGVLRIDHHSTREEIPRRGNDDNGSSGSEANNHSDRSDHSRDRTTRRRPDVNRGGEGFGYDEDDDIDENTAYDEDAIIDNIVDELEETRDIWI